MTYAKSKRLPATNNVCIHDNDNDKYRYASRGYLPRVINLIVINKRKLRTVPEISILLVNFYYARLRLQQPILRHDVLQ